MTKKIEKQINQERRHLGYNKKPIVNVTKPVFKQKPPKKIFSSARKKPSKKIKRSVIEESVEINEEAAKNLQKAIEALRSGPLGNERAALVEDVYSREFQGKELDLMKNSLGSEVLLFMLPNLSQEKFKILLEALEKDYETCNTNSLVFKVANGCIKTSLQHIAAHHQQTKDNLDVEESEELVTFFKKWLKNLATYLVSNIEKFYVEGKENCKLFKGFIEALQPSSELDELQVNNSTEDPMVHFKKGFIETFTFTYLDELFKFKNTVPGVEHKFTYLRLLRAIKPHNDIVEQCLRTIFAFGLTIDVAADEKQLLVFVTKYEDFVNTLCSVSPAAAAKIFVEMFKDEIRDLLSPKGVPFLRKLVAGCNKKTLLKSIILQILPDFSKLVIVEVYHSLLLVIAEACLRLKFWQKGYVKKILTVLHCFKPKDLQLRSVDHLLCLMPFDKECPERDTYKEITEHGSCIVQTCFSYDKPIKLVKSMLSMDANLLMKIAIDHFGSQIFEKFFISKTVNNKAKLALTKNFKGNLEVLASDSCGKRVLHYIWNFTDEIGDITLKSSLAEELAQSKNLLGNEFGRDVHQQFLLNLFIKDYEKWCQLQIPVIEEENSID